MTLHEDLACNITVTVIITGSLAFITMGLRVYTRITKRNWGVEDTIMSLGCVPLLCLSIATCIASYQGLGSKDRTFARPGNRKYIESAYFWFFIYQILYCVAMILVKLSIAFMLNRIAGNRKLFLYTNYAIMALCTGANLATVFYIIFQCHPIDAAWREDLGKTGGDCKDAVYLENVYFFNSAVNIFTDWATALMPIPLLWSVQMNRNSKLLVAGILGLGIFTSIAGLVRIKYTVGLVSNRDYICKSPLQTTQTVHHTNPFIYGLGYIAIWGYAEPALGMMAGNISTLRPIFQSMLRLGSNKSTTPTHTRGTPGGTRNPTRSHRYQPFDLDYELGDVGNKDEGKIRSIQIHGGRTSDASDSESQKQILEGNNQQIVVSQEVEISRE